MSHKGHTHVVVLVLDPGAASTGDEIREVALNAMTSQDVCADRAYVVHDSMSVVEVHTALKELAEYAIVEGRAIWIPNPQGSWSNSNREAVLLVASISELFGVKMLLGPHFEPLSEYKVVRGSVRGIKGLARISRWAREVAIDTATESLSAECIRFCGGPTDYAATGLQDLSTETTLLRGIGLNEADIVRFINAIAVVTGGRLIDESELGSSEHGN